MSQESEDGTAHLTGARQQLVELARRGLPLPGPRPRLRVPGLPSPRPAAVLVLIGALDDVPAQNRAATVPRDLDVLLLGRSPTLRHHPGQVSFPGGRLEMLDPGPEEAAVREAVEETGLDPAGVEVLGVLGQVLVPVSNHDVSIVLAWWAAPSPVGVVDHAESAVVFRAPVADLLDPANRRTATVRRVGATYRGPAFLVARDGESPHVVWGFTAMVLDRIFDELGWSEKWDTARTIRAPL